MAVGKKRSRQLRLFDEEKIKLVNSETLRLWKKYQQYMSIKELSEKTIYNYNTDLRQWFIYILDYQFNGSVLTLEEDDILEFISFCKDNGNNTERIKRRLSTISAFYKYLKKKKILQGDSPTEYIDRPKKGLPVVIQTYLTEEQLELIREKLNELGDVQLITYVELSLSTMARVNAISHLRWEQIDFENRVIEDVLEKEQRYVTLYFSEKVKDLLLQLKEYRETNNINDYGWLWYTPYVNEEKCVSNSTLASWTKRVSDMVDIPLHCHTWRKSASNLLKKKGMPLEDISTLLNHLDTSTTKKHYINSQDSNISALKDKYNI
ncbi:tyrosine-type recombinase/integrase [uncultured Thomasclavelia sp.]|uniref:tyrosine-type recombinase/integrase n=1 Tax=uncultured Thomasclavelia sp. TaxID=3025759 RepID=UPI00262BD0AB|nr:tyrosine-type recombinase/integrase [uncultured Thomasclavelia sp.]